ncbi:MAG: hypothetical protein V3V05_02925 [Pontiella sp.]
MSPYLTVRLCLLAALVLAGCSSSPKISEIEYPMSEREQKAALAHSKPPQFYSFSAYRSGDGFAMNGKARLHSNQMATIELLSGSIPVIKMRGRSPRMKLNALLDPSSPDTWMEFNTSQEFNANFMGMEGQNISYRGGYNTGMSPGYAAVVTQLRIDQLFIENCPLYVRMAQNSLGPMARGIKVPHVDAVLGNDFLQTFEFVQYDFYNNVIKFSVSNPYMPHEDLLISAAKIVRNPNFGLAVEGAIFGKSTPIILDFAGDYYFARGDVKVSSTKQVSLGNVVYRKVPTLLLPPNSSLPRAGRKMLEKYIITVCNREGIVYFERMPGE